MGIPFQSSQGVIDLMELRPQDVSAAVIAEALSKINRFSGHTRLPWSVAAHSLLVEALCENPYRRAWALLHDAHEAYVGDITTPAFELICESGTRTAVANAVQNAKGRIDRVIASAWGCVPFSASLSIRRADWIALQVERLHFFSTPLELATEQDRAMAERGIELIKSLPQGSDWIWAARAWMMRAQELQNDGMLTQPDVTTPASISLVG